MILAQPSLVAGHHSRQATGEEEKKTRKKGKKKEKKAKNEKNSNFFKKLSIANADYVVQAQIAIIKEKVHGNLGHY